MTQEGLGPEDEARARAQFKISLAAARVNAGLTQAEAARALGISNKTVVRYENGACKPPDAMLERMAKLYGVPPGMIRL